MRLAMLLVVLIGVACTRDPAEAICPAVGPGELVISELRGPQSPDDELGPWIELFNASGGMVDLIGLKIQFRRIGDGTTIDVLVRRSLAVPADGYVVLGMFVDDATAPSHVDYGFVGDYREGWIDNGIVEVVACGVEIDRMEYGTRLPRTGTYSFGGAPDADANDLPARWCTDSTPAGTTHPGTPGAPNIPCP